MFIFSINSSLLIISVTSKLITINFLSSKGMNFKVNSLLLNSPSITPCSPCSSNPIATVEPGYIILFIALVLFEVSDIFS